MQVERDEEFERVHQLQQLVVRGWQDAGLTVNDVDDFNPHVTVMKMSKLKAKKRRSVKLNGISHLTWEPFQEVEFGRILSDVRECVLHSWPGRGASMRCLFLFVCFFGDGCVVSTPRPAHLRWLYRTL